MAKEKNDTILFIVESPNKVKTISQFLPKNYIIKASVGHVTKIKDEGLYNLGIDVKGNFNIDFEVDPKKKDVVKELKEQVSRCDEVILATDPDREGESIAWNLKNVLNIPDRKYKRCTYTEVTKKAVEEALEHPRKIDDRLVDAALSRASLDKIVGYRLSPISRRKVSARSVGRCQSVGLKLIVEREEEITNFNSKTYYEIWLSFAKHQTSGEDINMIYKAQYKGLLKDKKNSPTIDDKELAEKIVSDCKGKEYKVHSIEANDRSITPKPAFITSTYQQEVSNTLGYSVKKAMECAQRLFEGINIGGQHVALITYIRTDDSSLSTEFVDAAKDLIINNYGKDYYVGPREKKKKANAQEAHEAIRPVDLSMTPEKLASYINDTQLLKVYSLIYNRALASLMSNCIITDTDFVITNSGYKFIYTEHAIKYDGFRKIYAVDDEELVQGLDIFTGETVVERQLDLLEKHTNPPKRYSESTLIKKLEDLGVGRPATYASIISILLDPGRGYAEEQGKAIAPTEKGIQLSHFLDSAFPSIINYNYSAQLEESLDLIAKGELDRVEFLKKFYAELEEMIKSSKVVDVQKPPVEEVGRDCPECGCKLVYRNGRFGKFIACSGFPKCRHVEKI